jgi:protein-S-isoprenylcysteine O-methyltransferase Ste14
MLKWLDMPPVWLAGCLLLAWIQAVHYPVGLDFGTIWADLLGGLMVGGGLVLIVMAAMEFRRYRTTIVPHETPDRLIQTGIFRHTRNPIYLGDALILAGLILRWDAVLALPLVPAFVWSIERRFIIPEENRMRRTFRMEFARYCEKTRRWL